MLKIIAELLKVYNFRSYESFVLIFFRAVVIFKNILIYILIPKSYKNKDYLL